MDNTKAIESKIDSLIEKHNSLELALEDIGKTNRKYRKVIVALFWSIGIYAIAITLFLTGIAINLK